MSNALEDLYQKIGAEVLSSIEDLNGKALIYAEVEDGALSDGILYEKGMNRTPTFKFCSAELSELIYSLWEEWKKNAKNKEWKGIAYLIEDGDFTLDFTYPDQMQSDEDMPERRPRVFKKYFGDVEIDYSDPD
jgi:hypothetical protein